jgi:hypothetical protein
MGAMGRRSPKKSETLEVRIPHEVKDALMRKAHAEGRSASEVVRKSIDSYLSAHPKEARSMFIGLWKPAAVAGAAAIAIVSTAISPAPSHAKPDLRSVFQTLDRNRDGNISLSEFLRDAADPNVEKMHHAHMTAGAGHKGMTAAHAQMMKAGHGKASGTMLRSHFAQLDANRDGSISFAEFQAFHSKMEASHGRH